MEAETTKPLVLALTVSVSVLSFLLGALSPPRLAKFLTDS